MLSVDHAVLVIGYTDAKYAYLDPADGERHSATPDEMNGLVSGSGNVFIGYVKSKNTGWRKKMKDEKYLELLAEKYPTEQAVCREIINLKAILSLPKGTEHFMSDLHGEYEAFCHILNNCSGVIREKVDLLFGDTLSDLDREEICTLIYYPVEKLALI